MESEKGNSKSLWRPTNHAAFCS